jgi:hypothetical protein
MNRPDGVKKVGGISEGCVDTLEQEILTFWRSTDDVGRGRIRRVLSGVLSGRVTLTLDEALSLKAGDVYSLADALPDEAPREWIKHKNSN